MRHLEQDAGAIAGVALEALATAVLEVHEHRERVLKQLMRLRAAEVGKCADAAGVMLELLAIERGGRLVAPLLPDGILGCVHVVSSPGRDRRPKVLGSSLSRAGFALAE